MGSFSTNSNKGSALSSSFMSTLLRMSFIMVSISAGRTSTPPGGAAAAPGEAVVALKAVTIEPNRSRGSKEVVSVSGLK